MLCMLVTLWCFAHELLCDGLHISYFARLWTLFTLWCFACLLLCEALHISYFARLCTFVTLQCFADVYNISTNLIQVIKNLYNKATCAVIFNSTIGNWFRTTVGVRQGCLLSPTLFNIFLERISTDTLKIKMALSAMEAEQSPIYDLLMIIDGLAEEEEEMAN